MSSGGETGQSVEVEEAPGDDGTSGGGDDGGIPAVLVVALLAVLVVGSVGYYVYGDEITELVRE